jgi:hypothetical protein
MPVKVNGLSIACRDIDEKTARRADAGSVILCRMDNGAVFRIFGLLLPGHSNWYRVHGARGAMETVRAGGYFGTGEIRIWHEEWDVQDGEEQEKVYQPDWPEHGELANAAGHGGGDFWTNFHFANAIRSGEPPFLDVYRGVAMSSVGILAWRSALADGEPLAVPDFRDEASRAAFADDHWSPWPQDAGPGQPPPSILGHYEPSAEGLAEADRVWTEMGYPGV